MATATAHWPDLDGYAAAHGLGYLQDFPIDRFANFVWYMLTRNSEAKEVDKLKAKLWQPEKGQVVTDPRSPWSAANEAGALGAFKKGMGG